MILGFLLLSLLLACTGLMMVLKPRRFAAVCEAFAAGGNLPSLLPRSVKVALLQVRILGACLLTGGIVAMIGSADLMRAVLLTHGAANDGRMNWLIVPAALGISAGYVILLYGTEWVARTFGKWADHPLIPQDMIVALTWEVRIAGFAFLLFGLGAASIWLRGWFGS